VTPGLSILTAQEVDELYRLPRSIEADRGLYFDLSTAELKLVDDVVTLSVAGSPRSSAWILKAKRQFFVYGLQAVVDDLEHILRRHFSARYLSEINPLSKPTRLEQQRAILKLFDYRSCDAGAKKELEGKAQCVAMLSAIEFDKTAFEWSFYGTLHSKFKLNLRHQFASLDFAGLRRRRCSKRSPSCRRSCATADRLVR
jgi:hypothetical protein